jgi:hypothetical protein
MAGTAATVRWPWARVSGALTEREGENDGERKRIRTRERRAGERLQDVSSSRRRAGGGQRRGAGRGHAGSCVAEEEDKGILPLAPCPFLFS